MCSFLAALDNPRAAYIAHDAGATVSMDPGWDEAALRDPRLAGMIREVDFFLPSEMELRHLTGEGDLSLAATTVTSTMREDAALVVKQGADGATIVRPRRA
ncbi:MAG: hypothetical protein R2873_34900 [Caldilineaceae bacterium]